MFSHLFEAVIRSAFKADSRVEAWQQINSNVMRAYSGLSPAGQGRNACDVRPTGRDRADVLSIFHPGLNSFAKWKFSPPLPIRLAQPRLNDSPP